MNIWENDKTNSMLRTKRNVYFQTKVISIKQDLKCRN